MFVCLCAISDFVVFIFDKFLIFIFIFVPCLWINSLVKITYSIVRNISKTSCVLLIRKFVTKLLIAVGTVNFFPPVCMFVEIFAIAKNLRADWTFFWFACLRSVFEEISFVGEGFFALYTFLYVT